MGDREEPDEHLLPSFLAEMNSSSPPPSIASAPALPSTWSGFASGSRASPAQTLSRHSAFLSRHASSHGQLQSQSLSDLDHNQQSPGPQSTFAPPNVFNNPNRSIFASGPPTASVSASLVHASMSSPPPTTPSTSSLSAFAASTPGPSRRLPPSFSQLPSLHGRGVRLQDIEKDTEDPSGLSVRSRMEANRREEGTPTAVSQLFAAPDRSSPPISRQASYVRTASGTQYARAVAAETAPLPNHLYTRGLLSGRHSDITIFAFGTRYPLHRLLLDRAPYFCSALSEPWMESSAKEITLHPEEIDSNITQPAFELALKRIYGCYKEEEEDKEAMGLFATGCWLDMADLIEASLNSLLRQLCPANISNYIRLVTNNYYGKHGDRILAAAKSMLCRDGWEMPLGYFDGVSGDIIREIIGSDGFYVPSEWDRFIIAKRVLNRRLRSVATDMGLTDGNGTPLISKPESLKFMAIRFDGIYRKTAAISSTVSSETGDRWLSLYTSLEIAPLLVLLDEGIHYVHMTFEQLQRIRETQDAMGLPIVPEKVITDALWMSMELRQRIVNAGDAELELGLTEYLKEPIETDEETHEHSFNLQSQIANHSHQKPPPEEGDLGSESWDLNGKPRKFWVPLADATFPLGGDLEPIVPEHGPTYRARHLSRFSTSIDPQDAAWATDFASTMQDRPESPPEVANAPSPKIRYTHYPPFRFAVEFPSTKKLKEKKRIYSSTVWYAGSLWNVYVQKTVGARHTQLGVYLHRARVPDFGLTADGSTLARTGSVDQRIDQLEREMIIGRNRRNNPNRTTVTRDDSGSSDELGPSTQVASRARPAQDITTLSGLLRSARAVNKASELDYVGNEANARPAATMDVAGRLDDDRDEGPSHRNKAAELTVPTIPPYFDPRPTTRTFFKIYTPSKSGRVLTVYESGPDRFNFSQSWGWRSSNLILDDGLASILNEEDEGHAKDPKLRFMVVLGNV